MQAAASRWLSGERLHLQHGPIDLIVKAEGTGAGRAYAAGERRFRTVLTELVGELTTLRQPGTAERRFQGPVAARMQVAIAPHLPRFVTPMAAVAGAVADEIASVMRAEAPGLWLWVNNGGDIAFCGIADRFRAAIPGFGVVETAGLHRGGLATSGWRGRSHALGIADFVTVLAESAAAADVAATLIANAVDLPGHPQIARRPARQLSPDSDLGDRAVTVGVGDLTLAEIDAALDTGQILAQKMQRLGQIKGAVLSLGPRLRITETTSLAWERGDD
ncbi:MAG: UPF0280 family protein [Pseudomonadota bacterium]